MTIVQPQGFKGLSWLVAEFAERTNGVSHAVVVSADGVALCQSGGLHQEQVDQLSTVASNLNRLAQRASRIFEADGVTQTVVEMGRGYLFLMSVGRGSCLAVLAEHGCEVSLLAYEMTLLSGRFDKHLVPEFRNVPSGTRR